MKKINLEEQEVSYSLDWMFDTSAILTIYEEMQEREKERKIEEANDILTQNNLPDLETLKKMFHKAYPEYNL